MSYVRSKQICVSRRILYSAHMSTAAAERLPGSVPSPATVPSQGPGQYSAQARPGRPAGLRERKKLATRQALGAAAMRLAVERGLENVFVEDIAAAAEVSPRTFNNYFASKYEAICALALDRSFQIGEALRERPASESLWDAVRNAVLAVYGSASEAPDHQVIARIQLVTCSPVLRGEYLKALSMMQYELAEAITERNGTGALGDRLSQLVLHHRQGLQVLPAQHRRAGDQLDAGDDLVVWRLAGRAIDGQHGVPDRIPQALAGGPFPQRFPDLEGPVQRQGADRLVFTGEVVVERPRRHLSCRRDVFDEHVLQTALDCQPHRRRAERLPGGELLALAQPSRAAGPGLRRVLARTLGRPGGRG